MIIKKYSEKLKHLAASLKNQHNDGNIENTYSFLRVAETLTDYLGAGYSKTTLNRTQIIILQLLLVHGGSLTPSQIKHRTYRSNNAISLSLDSLDKRGLTKSSRSKKDRRQRRVTLTEEGLKIMEQVLPIRRQLFTQAMNCLNKNDSQVLKSILSQLENHLVGIMGGSLRGRIFQKDSRE